MANIFKTITNTIKHWYVPLIIGVLFILLGLYIFTVPMETYLTLAFIFSISFIVSGVLDIYFAIDNRKSLSGWGWNLGIGILSLVIGVYLIKNPAASIATLPLYVGFVLLFRSIKGLSFSFELKEMKVLNWGDLAIASTLSLLLSFFLIAHPIFTGFSITTLTALSFIALGVSGIVFSFKLKKLKDFPKKVKNEIHVKIEQLKQEAEQELSS